MAPDRRAARRPDDTLDPQPSLTEQHQTTRVAYGWAYATSTTRMSRESHRSDARRNRRQTGPLAKSQSLSSNTHRHGPRPRDDSFRPLPRAARHPFSNPTMPPTRAGGVIALPTNSIASSPCWRTTPLACWEPVVSSESQLEALVRPVGWPRLRRFAGRMCASSVASGGGTSDPGTAIQAVPGSGVDAGRVGRLARLITIQLSTATTRRHRHAGFQSASSPAPTLGHESPAFTLREYADVIPGMQAAAAPAVAELVKAQGESDPKAA